jgi:hypothetical protein
MKAPTCPGAVRWAVPGFTCAVLIASTGGLWFTEHLARLEREAGLHAQGRQLFHGEASTLGAVPGRLAGHGDDLPAMATRCANCHTSGEGSVVPSKTLEFAPRLNRQGLAQPLARRGGPPSTYDSAALCKLLREGIDPAWVMIRQEMPRYAATDTQCVALWTFLVLPAQARP